MLDKSDKKYILRRIITYIAIAFIMFLFSSCQVKADEVKNPGSVYWWCNGVRNVKNITFNNGSWNTTMTCTNSLFQYFLQEWYTSPQTPGHYKLTIPNNPNINIYSIVDRPVITVLNTSNWENPIYSGTCSKDNSQFIECEFYASETFNYISSSTGVRIGGSGDTNVTLQTGQYQLFKIVDNTDVNNSINNMNNNITSEEGPTNSYDFVGYLPPGPLDSILNLPLQLLNVINNKLGSSCTPLILTIPFINETITLPCLWLYLSDNIPRLDSILTWISVVADIYILYHYLMFIYKWVDDTLTLRENNQFGGYE